MRDRVILLLIRAASRLPLWLAQAFGTVIGQLFYWIPNREQENARINLELCFPELDQAEREQLLRRTLQENAKTLMEAPGTWLRDPAWWLQRIDGQGGERLLRDLLAQGKGLIIAAPHIGNWEVGVHFLASAAPITALYRPPRLQVLEEVIKRGREQNGAKLVATDAKGVKALYGALMAGEMVGILPDQQPKQGGKSAGVFAPFFGEPALTMVLVNRLAQRSGAPVVYMITERLPRARGYCMHWIMAPEGIADPDPEIAAAALNLGVEQCARRLPTQYQWSYKRFEARPDGGRSRYSRRRSSATEAEN